MSRLAARVVLAGLEGIDRGELTVRLPDGSVRPFGVPAEEADSGAGARRRPGRDAGEGDGVWHPTATIRVRDWAFFRRLLLRGQVGAGASYIAGEWETDEPSAVVALAALNRSAFRRAAPLAWLGGAADRARHALRANTRSRARRNIHAHYDLGDDFFASFLDPSMTYSCALFEDGASGLEAAQRAKHRRIADRAGLQPGDRVLDIGCGWGAFAEYAARERRCRVTGITISRRQLEYARRRMERAGLGDRVEIRPRDYRDLDDGSFDRVVSVEMLEAVGHRYLPEFFAACERSLRPGGRAAVQVITVPDQKYALYRIGTDYIRHFVFPGSHLPSLGAMVEALAGSTSLRVREVESIGAHYAETLRRWRARFEDAHGVRGAGEIDERLYRLWRFYLAYCEGGFRAGEIDDLQVCLEKPGPSARRVA